MQTISHYELLDKIAEGGMGAVYRACDQQTGTLVAIKVVPPHLAKNQVMLKRFEQEYNAASSLNHPNIVRALDFGFHGESPFLVMEYIEGESLGDRLEREGRLPEAEALRIVAQVAQGLHKAHKEGLIHRDVKPDNILVTRDGQAKLADLGLVKELDADLNLTRTGRGLGTPHFMAPEQFRNAKNADARCDIYSLAATLYMMVTGELPFKSLGPLEAWMKKLENKITPARELVPTLSERVDWAIRRAMTPDPNLRPASCHEFIEDLTGQSTRRLTPLTQALFKEIWYLRFKDDRGVIHTIKDNLAGIRQALKEDRLGEVNNLRASKSQNGPFEPLKKHPEFRDLILVTESTPIAQIQQALSSSPSQTPLPPNQPALQVSSNAALIRPAAATPMPAAPAFASVPGLPPAVPAAARPASAPTPAHTPSVPHVHLETSTSQHEWLQFVLLIAVALLAGAAGFFLLPMFTK